MTAVTGQLEKHAITLINVGYGLGFCSGCTLVLLLYTSFELGAFLIALAWMFSSAIDLLLILGIFGSILQLGKIWSSVLDKYKALYDEKLDEVRGTSEYASLLARVDAEADDERKSRLRSEVRNKIKWLVVMISGILNLLVTVYTIIFFAATLPPATRIPAPYGAFLFTSAFCGLFLVPLLVLFFNSKKDQGTHPR